MAALIIYQLPAQQDGCESIICNQCTKVRTSSTMHSHWRPLVAARHSGSNLLIFAHISYVGMKTSLESSLNSAGKTIRSNEGLQGTLSMMSLRGTLEMRRLCKEPKELEGCAIQYLPPFILPILLSPVCVAPVSSHLSPALSGSSFLSSLLPRIGSPLLLCLILVTLLS
ncbi:Hypothetical predicted protein [Pelobates cultripes]|uniref:Uncharacterized protein n=1 Tax=Pelobates cultripes TaxID=61616 RepID=A0AAD1R918_PELCU|nr:Hypothetical predicted protein [Pelobates cultripes]